MQIQNRKFDYKEIPGTWSIVRIDSFLNINMGQSPPSESYNDQQAGLPFFQGVSDFQEIYPKPRVWCSDPKKIADVGQILLSVRAPVGEVNLANFKCCIGRGIAALQPINSDVGYCFYLLKQFKNKFLSYSQGTTFEAINRGDIATIKVPFTKELSEQQKIASILSKTDELIQKADQIIEQTHILKKGLMQRLFTKGIGHSSFQTVRLGFNFLHLDIPKNWNVTSMKTLSTLKNGAVLTGPFGSLLHSSDYVQDGIPFILGRNIRNGKIADIDIPRISKKDAERLSRYSLKEGDVVFSRVGTVGSTALVESKHSGWIISGLVLRIRFENPQLNPSYINYFIQSDIFSRILEPELRNASRDFINTTILENIPVPIPPKQEQNKIVKFISTIVNQMQINQNYKFYLENLKKGLMQKLLTGKIRVKV